MYVVFLLRLSSWQAGWCEQNAVVLVPLLREVARGVVTVHPNGKDQGAMALCKHPPSIAQHGVGESPHNVSLCGGVDTICKRFGEMFEGGM